ncbi:hypothetical protein LCL98_06080 [Rossellomorea aquimaris]|nr:hypothetical protein [Rossellomorea aquimaris]
MNQLYKDPSHFPRSKTIKRVMDVVSRIEPEAQVSDFFDITMPEKKPYFIWREIDQLENPLPFGKGFLMLYLAAIQNLSKHPM